MSMIFLRVSAVTEAATSFRNWWWCSATDTIQLCILFAAEYRNNLYVKDKFALLIGGCLWFHASLACLQFAVCIWMGNRSIMERECVCVRERREVVRVRNSVENMCNYFLGNSWGWMVNGLRTCAPGRSVCCLWFDFNLWMTHAVWLHAANGHHPSAPMRIDQ